jgi:hypothetical protein
MTTFLRPGGPGGPANRLRRAAAIALSAVLLVGAACSDDGGDDGSAPSTTPSSLPTSTEPPTTTVPFQKEQIVLLADGLGGELQFGDVNAARTINLLRQALGEPEKNQPLPAQSTCGATRRLQWGNLQVLVNEVTSVSGAGRPGFAGWYLGAPSATTHDLKTEKGVGIGSTVASLKAAYGADVSVARGEAGPGFSVTLPTGIMLGQLDALTDAGKVRNIQAGNYCGPG